MISRVLGGKQPLPYRLWGPGGRPVEQGVSMGRGQLGSPGFGQVERKAPYPTPSDSYLPSAAGENCRPWVLWIE